MRVIVGAEELAVAEAEALTELSVVCLGRRDDLASALHDAGLGELEEESYAWLDIEGLRSLARRAVVGPTREWEQGFAAMISYARGRGWVRGVRVRAHVDFPEDESPKEF